VNAEESRARIREREDLNAFISLTDEQGPGPAVGVKDLVNVRGTVTTGGGIILPAEASPDDAPVVKRMREAGCVMVGKTNLHEWAFGVTSANPHYGPVRNPHDLSRVPGGSSGGSAAAVAAGLVDWAVGSDTGGSIRIPASLCGCVGFKPTLGTIDTEGVIPLSRGLDTLGPLAPDVRSAALALEQMSELTGLLPWAARPLDSFRVATPAGWLAGLDEPTTTAWKLVSGSIPEIAAPDLERAGAAGLTILLVEAAAFHRRWLEEHPDKYGADVLRLLRLGLQTSRSAYVDALAEQSRLRVEMEAAMADLDALILPTTRIVAPPIGSEYDRADLTALTRPFNSTGQPVVVVPAPVGGLPVGIQVVGHFGQEAALVAVALAVEAAWV